jgi:HEAT repeat protein
VNRTPREGDLIAKESETFRVSKGRPPSLHSKKDNDMTTTEALEAIKSPDRNVRVRALRAAFAEAKPEGVDVILIGLGDTKRRVKEVALKSSRPFLGDPRVVERITAMVTDEKEYHRIRDKALFALGGGFPKVNQAGRLPEVAISALRSLAAVDRYRAAVLHRLVRVDLTPEVEALLNEYVRSGNKEEAVAATRALCGYRLVNWGSAKPAELAAVGAVHAQGVDYWIRRDAKIGPAW